MKKERTQEEIDAKIAELEESKDHTIRYKYVIDIQISILKDETTYEHHCDDEDSWISTGVDIVQDWLDGNDEAFN